MKFGGTSVKDAKAMSSVLDIIKKRRKAHSVIVLSACSGITDKLISITNVSIQSVNIAYSILDEIYEHHKNLIVNLIKYDININSAFYYLDSFYSELKELINGINILGECTEKSYNTIVSKGELLSTFIFYVASKERELNSFLLDSREFILLNKIGFDIEISFKNIDKLSSYIRDYHYIIMQGFIASNSYNETASLGRGGSDYTAALIGNAIDAKEIQIWTDVDGILTTDPKIVHTAKTIPAMSFSEVRTLSFYGAKVLHPDTIKPALTKEIPVWVKNTFFPDKPGTIISNCISRNQHIITSIHLNSNCLLLYYNNNFSNYNNADSFKINELLNLLDCMVFFSSQNANNSLHMIKPKNANQILTDTLDTLGYDYVYIDLICLCGDSLQSIVHPIPPISDLGSRHIIACEHKNYKNQYAGDFSTLHPMVSSGLIAKITAIAEQFGLYALLFGASANSFLVGVKQGSGEECLRALHRLCFE